MTTNEVGNDLTKVSTVELPFIPQQQGMKDDNKGDVTEYADELGMEQILYQEENDISYGPMSEENTETDAMLWKTVQQDIIKGNMDGNILEVGFKSFPALW